jgi:phenylalanyl-tRNA synthetase beta chain
MGAILLTGKNSRSNWSRKAVDVDFFDLKGIVEPLISESAFVPSEHLSFHPGRQADIKWGEQIIGSLGEVHPSLLEKFGIDQRVYYAELNLLNLMHTKKGHFKVAPLPQFPASQRDATFPLPLSTPIATLFTSIRELHLPLLEQVELIDLYTPEHLPQKNATFRFTYRDLLKTVSFEEVEKAHAKVLDAVTNLLAK